MPARLTRFGTARTRGVEFLVDESTMEPRLRPDLPSILPCPWPRTLAGRDGPLRDAMSAPAAAREPSFLVAVARRREPAAGDAGFRLHTAQQVAERVARTLASRAVEPWPPPPVHRLDADRVRSLWSDG